MKYELDVIESLISDIYKSSIDGVLSIDNTIKFREQIEVETKRIKTAFMSIVFSDLQEFHIERYMQFHQANLIRLANELFEKLPSNDRSFPCDQLGSDVNNTPQDLIYACIDELLIFLEKHFTRYFNPEAVIPNTYRQIAICDFKEILSSVEKTLNENFSEDIKQIVIQPAHVIINETNQKVTYQDLIYCKVLLKEISEMPNTWFEDDSPDYRLISSMLYLNYNSYRFINHTTRFLKNTVQGLDTLTEQLEKLAWLAKCFNQVPIKPGFSYKLNRKSLKDFLLDWVEEERNYLKEKHQLTINLPTTIAENPFQNFKIVTSLSVAQLAYFIRLLQETKIFINKNQKDVLRFIARHFQTKKAENISLESLRTKYYIVDQSTQEAITDTLGNLLYKARKNQSSTK